MGTSKSPTGIKLKSFIHRNFTGLDSSVDDTSQDSKDSQPLEACDNAYCDWRGQIVREAAGKKIIDGYKVIHTRFYGTDEDENEIVFAQENEKAITLRSDKGHELLDTYPNGSLVTSTVFNRRAILCSQNGYLQSYDGNAFVQNTSPSIGILSPKYVVAVQRRLVVAGLIGRPTEVQLSRVDIDNVFPDDEDVNDTNVLRGGYIDIGNQTGAAQEIQGLAAFEQNRLAIFTESKTLIYTIDPDIGQWALDDRANINIGTISHNTIRQAGTDLIFCSERGVHTISRSKENGITIFADVLSQKVDLVYRALLNRVTKKEDISAIWDQETSQYRIFFPVTSTVSTQLVLTINGTEENPQSWSTNSYLNARCGDVQGGRTIIGTSGGVYEVFNIEDNDKELSDVIMVVRTPVFWHGSMIEEKQSHSFFLHASGQGDLLVEIFDEHFNKVHAYQLEIEDDEDGEFPDNPIVRQYIRKFEAKYKGLRVQITSQGTGLIRIAALGFNVRK